MRRIATIFALTTAVFTLAIASTAAAATWTVTDGSEVVFTSKAPMESFDGKTKQITGSIIIDPADLSGALTMTMIVDLASLDTGIGLRNTHMRENHLETETFPKAVFTGTTVVRASSSQFIAGQAVDLTVAGIFDLHGVQRAMDIEAVATLQADGGLAVSAAFGVKLSDHEIKRPKFLVMKLADEQAVQVTIMARREDS